MRRRLVWIQQGGGEGIYLLYTDATAYYVVDGTGPPVYLAPLSVIPPESTFSFGFTTIDGTNWSFFNLYAKSFRAANELFFGTPATWEERAVFYGLTLLVYDWPPTGGTITFTPYRYDPDTDTATEETPFTLPYADPGPEYTLRNLEYWTNTERF